MNNGLVLAQSGQFGSIYRIPCRIVSVNIKGVTLHLTEDAFSVFSIMINEAREALLDKSLKDILKESES